MFSHLSLLRRINSNTTYRRVGGGVVRVLFVLMLAISLLGVSQTSVSAAGTTYYVNNTIACSDTNAGTSPTAPFCTIAQGANKAAVPGDTVQVVAGTYAETVYLTPSAAHSGTAGNPITFKAAAGVKVTGKPEYIDPLDLTKDVNYEGFAISGVSYIVIDGFTIDHTSGTGIYADGSTAATNNITLQDNTISFTGASSIHHPYEKGIVFKTVTDSTIINNTIHDSTCIGIRLLNGSDRNTITKNRVYANISGDVTDAAGIELYGASNNIISYNQTYDNQDSGINLYVNSTGVGSSNNLVIGNLSYGNGDHGIDNNNSPSNTIVGNTIQGNGTVGLNFEGATGTGSHTSKVYNNILSQNGYSAPDDSFGGNLRVDLASVSGTVIDYNIYSIGTAPVDIIWNNVNYPSLAAFRSAVANQDAHGLEADPKFVTPVTPVIRTGLTDFMVRGLTGDYHLQATSPAIDSANADAPSASATDLDGNGRIDIASIPNTGFGVVVARSYDDRGAYEFQPTGTFSPTVSTEPATSVASTTATFNSIVTNPGNPTYNQHGFVYGAVLNPTLATGTNVPGGTLTPLNTYSSPITGLTPGAVYHVRAYLTAGTNTVYGNDVIVTMLPALPMVTTQAVTGFTTTTAVGHGNVTNLGGPNPTEHGFVWSTQANPTITDNKTTSGVVNSTGAFTGNLNGLTPATTYHVRAYATNTAGTAYGGDVIFTTAKADVTVVVNCGAGTPTVNYKSTIDCVATITRTVGTATPTGTVSWTTNGVGMITTSPCTLAASADGVATCSVTYKPTSVGTGSHQITATYSGDSLHNLKTSFQPVTVNKLIASVTPNGTGKLVGEDEPVLTGTLTGFLAEDNVTVTYTRDAGETVGSSPYTIRATLSPASVVANYNVTYNTAQFTIVMMKLFLPITQNIP